MAENLSHSFDRVEHAQLWDDIRDVTRMHTDTLGIKLYARDPHAHLILVSDPYDAYEGYNYRLQLWSRWQSGIGIVRSLISYEQADDRTEVYDYEISPHGILHHAWNGSEPTPLDKDDLQDIRDDITHVQWNPALSHRRALKGAFFL